MGSLLSVFSPHPGSSVLASRSRLRELGTPPLEETILPPLELGLRGWGPSRGRRAAKLQIGLGSVGVRAAGGVGERGRGPGPPEPPSGAAVSTRGRPAFLHRQERTGVQGERAASPREDVGFLKPRLGPCPDPEKPRAPAAAPHSGKGRSRGPALGRGPGPRSRAGRRGRAGPALGGAG